MTRAPDHARRRAELERLVRTLDSQFRLPFTEIRFGWDAVLGLVPGFGDASSLVFSGAVIVQAVRLGVRGWTLGAMLLRALVDAVVGSVPVAGNVFDVVHRANERNLRLLERHLADPESTRTSSRTAVLLSLVVVVALVALWVFLLVGLTSWLLVQLF